MFLSKYLLIIKAGKIFEETAETSYVQNTKFQDQNLILLIIFITIIIIRSQFLTEILNRNYILHTEFSGDLGWNYVYECVCVC